jgi:hypothetical protein
VAPTLAHATAEGADRIVLTRADLAELASYDDQVRAFAAAASGCLGAP